VVETVQKEVNKCLAVNLTVESAVGQHR